MPTRLSRKKFDSSEVQGPGSHVIFRKPSWKESNEVTDELRGMIPEGTRTVGDLKRESADRMEERLFEIAIEYISEWNWVGDDKQPLPPLSEMARDELLSEEVDFLFRCIRELFMMATARDEFRGKSIG